ncbi:MAG: DMT family transporter [Verrucomicrobiota bacterium]|nr:DMT family transporter [Verrucomicrobiota bacterium]
MQRPHPHRRGAGLALAAAVLFGASTPFSKLLLAGMPPQWLAGLLYLGSGLGLAAWMLFRRRIRSAAPREAALRSHDMPWLAGAIAAGGVVAPVLLVTGLAATPAASASLLLNLEGVFTALLAWFVFKENVDRRILAGMMAIIVGGLLLSWEGRATHGIPWAALGIAGACLCWGIDNNLTRKVSAADPVQIAMLKGLIAGSVNVAIAAALTPHLPSAGAIAGAAVLGLLSYGVSLTFFVLALRHLGTARTAAYFSAAPFAGAALSFVVVRDSPTALFWPALACMALGVWLHLTEHHEHEHTHPPLEHDHMHVHDEHHQHEHHPADPPGEPHSHPHRHAQLTHQHPHTPDIHHQHKH